MTPTSTATQTAFSTVSQWQPATWEDYLNYRDAPTTERVRLFFNGNYLFVDMGSEGINHASFGDLFSMLFFIWFSRLSEQTASSLGGCLIEKPNKQVASPDIVLYIGEGIPQWRVYDRSGRLNGDRPRQRRTADTGQQHLQSGLESSVTSDCWDWCDSS